MKKSERKSPFPIGDVREFYLCIEDLLNSETVQRMKNFRQHGCSTTFDHCLVVSFRSFVFCKKYNMDYRAAARGGLLHDLFLYDWHDKKARCALHGFHHPGIALENALKEFRLIKKEEEIIKKHMWPLTVIPPRCREAYVIAYYDKVCTSAEVVAQWAGSLKNIFHIARSL